MPPVAASDRASHQCRRHRLPPFKACARRRAAACPGATATESPRLRHLVALNVEEPTDTVFKTFRRAAGGAREERMLVLGLKASGRSLDCFSRGPRALQAQGARVPRRAGSPGTSSQVSRSTLPSPSFSLTSPFTTNRWPVACHTHPSMVLPHVAQRPRLRTSGRPHPAHRGRRRRSRTAPRPSPGGGRPTSSRATRSSSAASLARTSANDRLRRGMCGACLPPRRRSSSCWDEP